MQKNMILLVSTLYLAGVADNALAQAVSSGAPPSTTPRLDAVRQRVSVDELNFLNAINSGKIDEKQLQSDEKNVGKIENQIDGFSNVANGGDLTAAQNRRLNQEITTANIDLNAQKRVDTFASAPSGTQVTPTTLPSMPSDPRFSQEATRLQNQETKVTNNFTAGKISADQETFDLNKGARIAHQLTADTVGGQDITAAQQRSINREITTGNQAISTQRHLDRVATHAAVPHFAAVSHFSASHFSVPHHHGR